MRDPRGANSSEGYRIFAEPRRRRLPGLIVAFAIALGLGTAVFATLRALQPRPDDLVPVPETERTWTFEAGSVDRLCGPDAGAAVRRLLAPGRDTRPPSRLSDQMPTSSPLEGYSPSVDGPVTDLSRPWRARLAAFGVTQGYARTFNSAERPGGFTVFAYEFPDGTSALRGAVESYSVFVCDFGADPLVIPERSEIAGAIRPTDTISAWWVHGNRIVGVDYSMLGETTDHRSAALSAIVAAWDSSG